MVLSNKYKPSPFLNEPLLCFEFPEYKIAFSCIACHFARRLNGLRVDDVFDDFLHRNLLLDFLMHLGCEYPAIKHKANTK